MGVIMNNDKSRIVDDKGYLDKVKWLYHGTDTEFEKIILNDNTTSPFKDFGKGFYVTTNKEQALKWAKRRAKTHNKSNGFVYKYSLGTIDKGKLKIKELCQYDQEWLDYISNNRVNGEERVCFDLIYDKMADNTADNLNDILRSYVNDKLRANPEFIINKIKFENEKNDQVCFKSEEAIKLLVFSEKIVC